VNRLDSLVDTLEREGTVTPTDLEKTATLIALDVVRDGRAFTDDMIGIMEGRIDGDRQGETERS